MKRVTGIGGIFFKTSDPEKTKEWYSKHLGIESDQYGGKFAWNDPDNDNRKSYTVWSPFTRNSEYFDPSQKEFMFNYRVDNLVKLLKTLEKEGVQIVGKIEEFDYGKFGWIMDNDGNKIELWEPKNEHLFD